MLTGLFSYIHNFILSPWFIVLSAEFPDQRVLTILTLVHIARILVIYISNIWAYLFSHIVINLGYNQWFCCLNLGQSDKQFTLILMFTDAECLCRFSIDFIFLLKWIAYLSPLPTFLPGCFFLLPIWETNLLSYNRNAFPQFII